jgi:hypothetical protein
MVSVKAQFDRRRVRTACGKNKDRAAKGFSGVYGTNGIEQRTPRSGGTKPFAQTRIVLF